MFIEKIYRANSKRASMLMLAGLYFFPCSVIAQTTDSIPLILKKVTITPDKRPNFFKNLIPAQRLDSQQLLRLNAQSIGDAARYFSGVLIKDYGGIGGLKTISVRSLGASNTAIIYDGIPVSEVQSGQVDLSRFSGTFVESIELYQANPPGVLLTARSFASASVLSITTHTFDIANLSKLKWQGGIKAGSFGLWQPFAGIYIPTGKSAAVSANIESIFSKGNYPFYIDNGSYSKKSTRTNSEIRSYQGEINFIKKFSDSSTWQSKLWGYTSKRGLPGAIIFFNERSVQKLTNTDLFVQSRYHKDLSESAALLLSVKYSHSYTRYTDPDFLNNAGGLDDRYKQEEFYASAAVNKKLMQTITVSLASDASYSKLTANLPGFAYPSRLGLWNNLSGAYSVKNWQFSGSLLYTHISDEVKTGSPAANKDKLSPTIAVSYKPASSGPFILRAFYKDVFRMPTFNDLYYNFIGNNKLRPEYSRQYDLGFSYSKNFTGKIRQLNFSADGYYNSIKDKIIAIPSQNLFVWTILNLGEVSIKGIDITTEASGKISTRLRWFARVAYTYQQALDVTDKSSQAYKDRIPYTPDNSGSAIVNFNFNAWGAGYNILFSGDRYTLGVNDPFNQLPGWLTQDFFVSRQFTSKHFSASVKAEINNITNKYFDVIRYYPMPGRSFKIGLTIHNL